MNLTSSIRFVYRIIAEESNLRLWRIESFTTCVRVRVCVAQFYKVP